MIEQAIHGVEFEVNGVKKHSFIDFRLHFNPVSIPYPEVKENYVEKQFADGSLDLTEADGRVYYKDRTFTLSFECNDRLRYDKTLDKIASFLHGQRVKMTFYFDRDYYYIGRASINKYTSDKGMGTIEVDVTVRPYKYKQLETITINTITGSAVINYLNDRMTVVPTFKADTDMNFEFNGNQYALSGNKGTIFPNLEFKEGDNIVKWTGNGTVTVSYQEGAI